MRTQIKIALVVATVMASSAVGAFAETMAFKATLTGAEEVPPTTSKGVGSVDVTFDPATKKISWKGTYSGLSGPATAAHFHGPADKGANAGVAVAAPASASPFEGTGTLSAAQESDLVAGKMYFNIHTASSPGGEIRGQVVKN